MLIKRIPSRHRVVFASCLLVLTESLFLLFFDPCPSFGDSTKDESKKHSQQQYFGRQGQDRWILKHIYSTVSSGYFVDVGAYHPTDGSNTKAFELRGWNGVCIEPFPVQWKDRRCQLFKEVVSSKEGEKLEFRTAGLYGGLDKYLNRYKHEGTGKDTVEVVTTTLAHILQQAAAPSFIDYISIDVEGAEYEVLKGFPFSKYVVGVWTIEHNRESKKRKKIYELMNDYGYRLVWSDRERDDFYLHKDLPKLLQEHHGVDLQRRFKSLPAPDPTAGFVSKSKS